MAVAQAIDLEALVARAIAEGRAAWPEVTNDAGALATFVAARLPDEGTEADVPVADLYLACACARGDRAAIAAFERRHFGDVDAVLARMRHPEIAADDVRQALREKLFVGTPDAPPRIAEYGGKGVLAGWFRVLVTRLVLNLVRGPKDVAIDDARILELPGGALDQELEYMKRRYGAEFREAFATTLAGLSPRERALLRYALVDGLGSDAIALVYGVHRTTVNRWLVDVRAALAKGVRAAMRAKLRVSNEELESIMRLIESRMEITLGSQLDRA